MELRQLLRTLRRRWKFTVAVLVLSVAGAGIFSALVTPTYSSTSQLYVTATGPGDPYQLGVYAAQRVTSYASLTNDPSLLQRVIDRAGLDTDINELADHLTAEAVPQSVVIRLTAVDESPKVAQTIAAAAAEEMVALVERLEGPGRDAPEGAIAPITVKIAGDPTFNEDPISPNVPLNLVVGALIGLLLGVAGAVLRDLLDTSVKNAEELAELTGHAVMSVVPTDNSVDKHPLITDPGVSPTRGEPYRVLRTNLQFTGIDSRNRTIQITSVLPNEGKTTVSANLAIAFAQSGRRVLLIDADLRHPSLAAMLDLDNSVGVTTALLTGADLEACVQTHATGIDVLATGPTPPNPAEVLETEAMTALLNRARESYDIVVIDTPPLLPVADPAILASKVDGVLLIARYGRTRKDELLRATQRLAAVDARVLGVLLNATPKSSVYSSYGYGYAYAYAAGTLTQEAPAQDKGRRRKARTEPSAPAGTEPSAPTGTEPSAPAGTRGE